MQEYQGKIYKYKDKDILLVDYSNCTGDQVLERIPLAEELTLKQNRNDILQLVDVRNSKASSNAVEALKKSATKVKPYIKKNAVVGVTPLQKIFLQAVNLFSDAGIVPFDTIEEAQDWLIQD